jgi:hypothetical protein
VRLGNDLLSRALVDLSTRLGKRQKEKVEQIRIYYSFAVRLEDLPIEHSLDFIFKVLYALEIGNCRLSVIHLVS